MKKLIVILLLAVLLIVPVACAAPPQASAPAPMPGPIPAPAPMPPVTTVPSYPGKEGGIPIAPPVEGVVDTGQGDLPLAERMIIRTGDIYLVVSDVALTIEKIARLAEQFDGYVVSSNSWQEGERLAGSISFRVLAENFDAALRALREMAVDVTSESTYSQDVTEEYTDLSAKLHNLEATEVQLLRLMEKAEKVEEILNVQRELSSVRGEIERIKGRMQYLERTSATSLIQVYLQQAELDVNFTASKRSVKEGQAVEFEGRIAGGFAPYSHEWDFGDGDTSTSDYPVHVYETVGRYTVSLKVTDDRGNIDSETRDEYITVLPGWEAGSVAGSAWNGLVTFGQVLANIAIWLGIFSPVWIIGGGIAYWLLRRRRRKKA